jgi:hypothetical protein
VGCCAELAGLLGERWPLQCRCNAHHQSLSRSSSAEDCTYAVTYSRQEEANSTRPSRNLQTVSLSASVPSVSRFHRAPLTMNGRGGSAALTMRHPSIRKCWGSISRYSSLADRRSRSFFPLFCAEFLLHRAPSHTHCPKVIATPLPERGELHPPASTALRHRIGAGCAAGCISVVC